MVDEHEQTARKSPRMRFTIRRMMVGVAIVAVIMVVSKTLFIDNQPTDYLSSRSRFSTAVNLYCRYPPVDRLELLFQERPQPANRRHGRTRNRTVP